MKLKAGIVFVSLAALCLLGIAAAAQTTNRVGARRGHGDLSLEREGSWRMILAKGKGEIGNSGYRVMRRHKDA